MAKPDISEQEADLIKLAKEQASRAVRNKSESYQAAVGEFEIYLAADPTLREGTMRFAIHRLIWVAWVRRLQAARRRRH